MLKGRGGDVEGKGGMLKGREGMLKGRGGDVEGRGEDVEGRGEDVEGNGGTSPRVGDPSLSCVGIASSSRVVVVCCGRVVVTWLHSASSSLCVVAWLRRCMLARCRPASLPCRRPVLSSRAIVVWMSVRGVRTSLGYDSPDRNDKRRPMLSFVVWLPRR